MAAKDEVSAGTGGGARRNEKDFLRVFFSLDQVPGTLGKRYLTASRRNPEQVLRTGSGW